MSIDQDRVPTNLDEAVEIIIKGMGTEDIQFVKDRDNSVSVHHTMGRYLRNSWSLWDKDTHLVQWFIKEHGLCHADDLSGLILDALWCKIRGEKHDIEAQVDRYKEHWLRAGINPKTQEKMG